MSTSYSNFGGSGYRSNYIGVTTTLTLAAGSIGYLVGGGYANSLQFNTQAVVGLVIEFYFTSTENGVQSVVIDEAKWYQSTTTSQGVWNWQGSNDGSTWTNIGTNFTLGGATTQTMSTLNGNTTAYGYYRMTGISGTCSNGTYDTGIDFQISGFNITYVPFMPAFTAMNGVQTPVFPTPSFLTTLHGTITDITNTTTASTEAGFEVIGPLSPAGATPQPVAANLLNATLNAAYSETISAQGGTPAYTFSVTIGSLPTGLSLAPSTGIISGTPTATGTFNFTIKVTDAAAATGTQPFQITVAAVAASNYGVFH